MSELKPTITQRLDSILGAIPPNEEGALVANEGDGKGPLLPAKVVSSGNPDRDFNDDFDIARTTLRTLIDKGTELSDAANYIAKEKQDARSIEAAAIAQKEARDNALALLDLHQKKADLNKGTGRGSSGGDTNIQNNAVFVGTTGELLKFTRDLNKNTFLQDALKPLENQIIDGQINTEKEDQK
jgi:hypothetical protein